jgi:hypothetical protein
MDNRLAAILVLGFFGLGAGFWLALGGGGGSMLPAVDVRLPEEMSVDVLAKGITLTHGRDGEVLLRLKAETGTFLMDSEVVEVSSPKITIRSEGEVIDVVAPRGVLHRGSEAVTLSPDFRAEFENGAASGRTLVYEYGTETLRMQGYATVSRNGYTLSAQEMDMDLKSGSYSARGDVRAVLAGAGDVLQSETGQEGS